jgi:hypothetical protein
MLPVSGKLDGVAPHQGYRPATSWLHYTTSCKHSLVLLEDGRNPRPKHAELIGIVNKPLLLHLLGFSIICISDVRSNKHQICRSVGGICWLKFVTEMETAGDGAFLPVYTEFYYR